MAARLSEDPEVTVTLLEAGGPDRHPLIHVPAGFARMTRGIASWGWSTVPQRHLKGRVLWYTQARVLGGGSSINARIYTRGHPADYDGWATDGCDGWSYRAAVRHERVAGVRTGAGRRDGAHRRENTRNNPPISYPRNHVTNLNVCARRATLRAVAGNHASSRPAPSGECADRARTPRKPTSLTLVPMGWQRV